MLQLSVINKLWKKLIGLDMSKGELRVKSGISTRQLAKLGKNESVSTQVLVKICKILGCTVDEIIDMIEKKEENEKGDIES